MLLLCVKGKNRTSSTNLDNFPKKYTCFLDEFPLYPQLNFQPLTKAQGGLIRPSGQTGLEPPKGFSPLWIIMGVASQGAPSTCHQGAGGEIPGQGGPGGAGENGLDWVAKKRTGDMQVDRST